MNDKTKRVAIIQSNYIPWKGYFDIIASVDELVLYDDAQFTKNDWRNRNRIKTPSGVQWISIPVHGSTSKRIRDVTVSRSKWNEKHWKVLQANYAKAGAFRESGPVFEEVLRGMDTAYLSEINHRLIERISRYLGIDTKISRSSDYHYDCSADRSGRVLSLCQSAGGCVYVSGPTAKEYLDTNLFREAGVEVEWMDYSGYPEYPQLFPPFEHAVTVLDLIFNVGPNARTFMKRAL